MFYCMICIIHYQIILTNFNIKTTLNRTIENECDTAKLLYTTCIGIRINSLYRPNYILCSYARHYIHVYPLIIIMYPGYGYITFMIYSIWFQFLIIIHIGPFADLFFTKSVRAKPCIQQQSIYRYNVQSSSPFSSIW